MKAAAKLTKNLKNLKGVGAPPSPKVFKEVQVKSLAFLGLLTSFSFGLLVTDSAYAAYSVSISRASSETVSLGSIKPSSAGTLGTGSDVVTVSSNCSAGYNLYVSAISGGSTNLSTSGGLDYIPSTTTATGSEAALSKDTWGIGKDGVTFSKLQSYSEDLSTMSPLYTDSGNKDYTIYYGVNVSTAKTPGTYTGDVLYTVLMNGACLEYTLKFDDNGATSSNLPDQTISFGQAVNLSEYSATDKISKTGYHLLGWKIKDGDGTLLPTNNNTSLDDGESSELTLIAEWEANTYTIAYDGNGSDSGSTSSQTSQAYSSNVTLQTNGFTRANYNFLGWSLNSSATASSYNANTSYAVSTIVDAANKSNDNGATITLYAVWKSDVTSFADVGVISGVTTFQSFTKDMCSQVSVGQSTSLVDDRNGAGGKRTYNIKKLTDGKCWMTQNLALYDVTIYPSDSNITVPSLTIPNSASGGFGNGKTMRLYYAEKGSTTNYDSSCDSNYPMPEDTVYYNIYTASANTFYSGDGASSGGTNVDICPKGWRLPTGGANGDWNQLDIAVNGKYDSSAGAARTNADSVSRLISAGSFTRVGYYNEYSGKIRYLESVGGGFYFSSTAKDSSYMWCSALDSNNVGVSNGACTKRGGYPVRCVAKS